MIDVLLVEDDAPSREALSMWMRDHGAEPREACDYGEGVEQIRAAVPALGILDIDLPGGSGLDLLRKVSPRDRSRFIVVSGVATQDLVIEAFRLGAYDFLTKPLEFERLDRALNEAAESQSLRTGRPSAAASDRKPHRQLIGDSEPMRTVSDRIAAFAGTEEPVLITGSTGTGKELVAQQIHVLSSRARHPLVAVNCGALPSTLVDSELFGHERGAFTGADKRRAGVFEQANGGTLFLDEVTEMPLETQVKLLRVLETSTFTRLGGSTPIDVDVRIIAATNRDPKREVARHRLRSDLYYRLAVLAISLPPLAERDGDVELLARAFLEDLVNARAEGLPTVTFADSALAALASHSWPGNVRELRNAMRRAFVLASTSGDPAPQITTEHLGLTHRSTTASPRSELTPGMSIADAERQLIELTLKHVDGDKQEAARILGVSLKTLYARLKIYRAADGKSA